MADAQGHDLLVESHRRRARLHAAGRRHVFDRGHDLTFQGGPSALLSPRVAARSPARASAAPAANGDGELDVVAAGGSAATRRIAEVEPNNRPARRKRSPCRAISRAAFSRRRTWILSSSLRRRARPGGSKSPRSGSGLNTDPFVLVQQVTKAGDNESSTDVAELNDIPSPIKCRPTATRTMARRTMPARLI